LSFPISFFKKLTYFIKKKADTFYIRFPLADSFSFKRVIVFLFIFPVKMPTIPSGRRFNHYQP